MREKVENDMDEVSVEQFNDALKTVNDKHPKKYEFIL